MPVVAAGPRSGIFAVRHFDFAWPVYFAIALTVSSAIKRYVVSLPPVTSHQPASFIFTSWRREISDGLPLGSAPSGRRPAQWLKRSERDNFALGNALFTTSKMYSISASSQDGLLSGP